MSSILRLFGDRKPKQNKKVSAAAARAKSLSKDNTHSFDPATEFHESFSEDGAGQELRRLWLEYSDFKSKAGSPYSDRSAILHNIVLLLIQSCDCIDTENWKGAISPSSPSFQAPSGVDGHPASLVLEIIMQFFNSIRDQEKEKTLENNADSDDEADLPKVVTISGYAATSDVDEAALLALKERREVFLNMLRAISVMIRWSHNCSVIRHTLEMNFARLIVALGRQLMGRIQALCAAQQSEQSNEELLFTLKSLVLTIQVVLNGISLPPLEFLDLLPSQPWSLGMVEQLLDPDRQWDEIVSHQGSFALGAAGSSLQQKKTKAEYLHNMAIAGSLKFFMEIVHNITELQLSNPPISREIRIMLGIVEAEALFGISGLVVSFPDFVSLELNLFKPIERTFDMKNNTVIVHDPLLIRKGLLCLRMNSWLLTKLRAAKPEAPHYSIRLFNITVISSFLNWLSLKFDNFRRPGDWIEQMATSPNYCVHLNISLKLGRVTTGHDLWPWREPSDSSDYKANDVTDFHILQKSVSGMIQASIKVLPGSTVWDSAIAEILGSYMLASNRQSTVTAKVNKDNLHYVYEVFDSFFRNKQFVQMDFLAADGPSMTIPLSQLKFLEFISQLFKAVDASNIFSIISEFETFRFLLGEKFLLGHNSFTSHLSDIFADVAVKNDSSTGSLEVHLSTVKNKRFECIYLWLYLQNSVLDYFHGLVIYSLYFQTEHDKVQAYLSFEDILIILSQYMLSLSKPSRFPGHIVYQLACLVLNLNDIVLSMAFHSSSSYLLRVVRNLLDILECQLRGKLIATSEKNGFELAGCFAVVQLLLHLIEPSTAGDFTSKDIFVQTDSYVTFDLIHEINSLTRPRANSESPSSKREARFSVDAIKTGEPGEKGLRVRASLSTLLSLLLSEHFQCAGLVVVQSVVVSCAVGMSMLEKASLEYEDRQKRKLALRSLASEVIGSVFQLIAVSYKHPVRSFSVSSARSCLDAVTVLLRDDKLSHLRIHIQEFIRRENLLYELLRALAKCLNGHEMIKVRTYSDDTIDPANSYKPVLCAGLATLTGIVCGNEACKNALRMLLNSSREKVGASKARFATSLVERKDKSSPVNLKSASGLVSLILCAEKVPSVDVVIILMDLLLDGPGAGRDFKQTNSLTGDGPLVNLFGAEDDKPTLRNTAVLQDFFQLMPHCEESVQRFALESFRNLISGRGSLVNLTVCATTRPKVFDIALDLFPYIPDSVQTCNAELLDLLGRYVVSVSSLKHLFRMLQKSDGSSPVYSWKVIQALQGMFLEDLGPKHTFVLDGQTSGLRLPTIHRWPKLKGLSFTCWLRVEAPKINYDWLTYAPHIFSWRDEKGSGFQFSLKQTRANGYLQLYFRYINENGEVLTAAPTSRSLELMEGKWYFLALSVSQGSFYSKGEVKIHVNTNVYREDIGQWKVPDSVPEPLVGDCPNMFRVDNEYHTLRGQMGAIYFFNEALSEQQVQGIYALGPDYIYNFEPYSAGYKDLTTMASSSSSFKRKNEKKSILDDGSVTSKILLAFNPVVLRGKYFLDNTPEKNEVLWRLPTGVEVTDDLRGDIPKHCKMHAMRLTGTYRSTTQDVRLALNSLGGIKAIVPLFAQLVQSSSKLSNSTDDLSSISSEQVLNSNFFPAVLGLFTTLIEDNEDNKRIFLRCGGFSVIRDFLEKAPGGCFNLITLNQFVAILENLRSDAVAKESCFDTVLCNFRLWARAGVEVQGCWLDWLINAMGALDLTNPGSYSAQRFIDTFYTHYDYAVAQLPILSQQSIINESVTVDAVLMSPSSDHDSVRQSEASKAVPLNHNDTLSLTRSAVTDEQLRYIRSKVYHLIKISILRGHAPAHEAAVGLMKYMTVCSDPRGKIETLRFLEALLMSVEDHDKMHGVLLGLTLTDSLLALEAALDISNVKLYQATLSLVGVIAYLVSIHNLDFSSCTHKLHAEPIAQVFSPTKSTVVNSDEMSMFDVKSPTKTIIEHAEAVVFSADFKEIGNLQIHIPRICTTALAKLFTYDVGGLIPWTLSILQQILLGIHAEGGSEESLPEIRIPTGKSNVAYPSMFVLVMRLLASDKESIRPYGRLVMEQLSRLLTVKISKQVVAVPHWEATVVDLLELQSRAFLDDISNAAAAITLQYSLQMMMTMTQVSLTAEYSIDSQSFKGAAWDSYSKSHSNHDFNGVTSIRDILSALKHGSEVTVRSFAMRSVILVVALWESLKLPLDVSSKSDMWRTGCTGLALLDHLTDCGSISELTWEEGTEDLWTRIVCPLLASKLPECAAVFSSLLAGLFKKEIAPHFIVNINWSLIKLFFNLFECHRWQAHCLAVDEQLASVFPMLGEHGSGVYSALKCDELTASDERRLFRAGTLPLVGLRNLYGFHALSAKLQPAGQWGKAFMPFYLHILKGIEPYNYELFAFERLYFICTAPTLGVSFDKDELSSKYVDSASGELTDFLNITNFDMTVPEDRASSLGEDKRLDIITAILGHNIMPNFFKMHYSSFVVGQSPEDPFVHEEFMSILETHGVRFPADSPVSKGALWSSVSDFLLNCGKLIIEEVLVRQQDAGRERAPTGGWALKSPKVAFAAAPPAVTPVAAAIARSAGEMLFVVMNCECDRLNEWLRQQHANNRRCEMKRSRLFAQLANERGPWGYGADHKREIFWTLDQNETNSHSKLRLKRNLMGTRHSMASFKATGKLQSMSEDNNDMGNGPLGWFEIDLKKYKGASSKTKGARQLGNSNSDDKGEKPDEDDLSEGEEEGPDEVHVGDSFLTDNEQISVPVEIVSSATNSSGGKTVGKLDVNRHKISFHRAEEFNDHDFENKTGNNEFLWACQCFLSTSWTGAELCGVYRRYYQLRYVGLEIFLTNRTSIFFNLFESSVAKRVYTFLTKRMRAPNMSMIFTGRPKNAINRIFTAGGLTVTQAWVTRKITNFDYLMYLNFIAGRTCNDLAQYPVFPWVLSDYTSSKIDLKDPAVYRKFERPIGAQLDSQQAILAEKYESSLQLQDDGIYPYHCGSHYSTSAMVLWYMIRMEPFTSFHVWLQDGKFDRPDRLFHGIANTFHGCTTNTQDVKELIPEFFYNPEFLNNLNHVSLGSRQDGEAIDDVVLPRWCKDANDFVRIHRDALESEYVSSQLHNWIDLIFGCKQRPPFLGGSDKTVQACNVFFHLSYADAVDLDAMKASDPDIYNRTIRQIDNYGQTPMQLFKKEHPRRKSLLEVQDILWPIASIIPGADTVGSYHDDSSSPETVLERPKRVLCYGECKVSNFPVLFMIDCPAQEKLVTIDSNRVLGYHVFQMRNPSHVPPFSIKLDKMALSQSTGQVQRSGALSSYLLSSTNREKVVGIPFASPVVLNASLVENMAMQQSSSKPLMIGTRDNKMHYLEDEIKARGRLVEERPRLVKSASARPVTSRKVVMSASNASLFDGKMTPSPSMKDLQAIQEDDKDRKLHSEDVREASTVHAPEGVQATPTASHRTKTDRSDYHLSSHLFCYLPALRLIFSCGHWDNAFKVTAAETGKLVQSISHHREVVTCIACASDHGKHWVVVGSKDCTITVWEIFPERESEPIHAPPAHTLYGHDDSVNCVVIHGELDLIVSGSDDGTIMIHTLREGSYVRSIILGALADVPTASSSPSLQTRKSPEGLFEQSPTSPRYAVQANTHSQQFLSQQLEKVLCRVHLLAVSKEGNIVAYSNDGCILASYTQNGRYMKLIQVRERIHALCLSEDGKTVLTGGERGLVVIRWVHNLAIASSGARKGLESIIDGSNEPDFEAFPSPIRSLALTSGERHILVGLDTGEVRILAQDSEYLRRKLHRQLIEIGMLSI